MSDNTAQYYSGEFPADTPGLLNSTTAPAQLTSLDDLMARTEAADKAESAIVPAEKPGESQEQYIAAKREQQQGTSLDDLFDATQRGEKVPVVDALPSDDMSVGQYLGNAAGGFAQGLYSNLPGLVNAPTKLVNAGLNIAHGLGYPSSDAQGNAPQFPELVSENPFGYQAKSRLARAAQGAGDAIGGLVLGNVVGKGLSAAGDALAATEPTSASLASQPADNGIPTVTVQAPLPTVTSRLARGAQLAGEGLQANADPTTKEGATNLAGAALSGAGGAVGDTPGMIAGAMAPGVAMGLKDAAQQQLKNEYGKINLQGSDGNTVTTTPDAVNRLRRETSEFVGGDQNLAPLGQGLENAPQAATVEGYKPTSQEAAVGIDGLPTNPLGMQGILVGLTHQQQMAALRAKNNQALTAVVEREGGPNAGSTIQTQGTTQKAQLQSNAQQAENDANLTSAYQHQQLPSIEDTDVTGNATRDPLAIKFQTKKRSVGDQLERQAQAVAGQNYTIAVPKVQEAVTKLENSVDPTWLGTLDPSIKNAIDTIKTWRPVVPYTGVLDAMSNLSGIGMAIRDNPSLGPNSKAMAQYNALYGAMNDAIDNAETYHRQLPTSQTQIAYHGSPNTFDQFSSSNIGMGDGSQAYGHGLYFASNQDVAKYYMNAAGAEKGRLYRAEIPGPDEYLDWDVPVSEQSPKVQAALQKAGVSFDNDPFGEDIYRQLVKQNQGFTPQRNAPAEASKALQDAGIAGIRYKDVGTGASVDGNSNYVVFDPNRVSIRGGNEQGPAAQARQFIANRYGENSPQMAAYDQRAQGQKANTEEEPQEYSTPEVAPNPLPKRVADTTHNLRQQYAAVMQDGTTGIIGQLLQRDGRGYAVRPEKVIDSILQDGPTRKTDLTHVMEYGGNDPAITTSLNAGVMRLMQKKQIIVNGTVDPNKLTAFMRDPDNRDIFAALPDLGNRLNNAATAQQFVSDTLAQHKALMDQFDVSQLGRITRSDNPDLYVKTMLDQPGLGRLQELGKQVYGTPAQDGLVKAVMNGILDKFTKPATDVKDTTTGLTNHVPGEFLQEKFRNWIGDTHNRNALKAVLGGTGYKNLDQLEAQIQRAKLASAPISIPGSQTTPMANLIRRYGVSPPRASSDEGKLISALLTSNVMRDMIQHGPKTALLTGAAAFAGGVPRMIANALDARGIKNLNDLRYAVHTDPALYARLLQTVPSNVKVGPLLEKRIAEALIPATQSQVISQTNQAASRLQRATQ